MLQQQMEIRENYEKEILRTQIEIRDQAMNDVGRELHDHISQVMTLIKLNMNLLASKGLDEANEIIMVIAHTSPVSLHAQQVLDNFLLNT